MQAAKYSPLGDRIATATRRSIRVWDSSNGHSLVDINKGVTTFFHNSLLWFKNHLFVISNKKIKEFDASTGSEVSKWPIPSSDYYACIALPKHRVFIVYSAKRTITFWDTSMHSQLCLIQHHKNILSVAFSPDDRFLAFGGTDGKITIKNLTVRTTFHWFGAFPNNFPAFPSPERCHPLTLFEGVGKSDDIGEYPMERCLACCFRRERHPCFCSPRSIDTDDFQSSFSAIYWVICDRLETIGRITDAVECFNEMTTDLGGETNMHGEVLQWASGEWSCTTHIVVSLLTQDSFLSDFRQRSFKRLERSGDAALNAQ